MNGWKQTDPNPDSRSSRPARLISAVLAAVLALSLAACGGNGGGNTGGSGGSGKPAEQQGGAEAEVSSADCVYSAEELVITDDEGLLSDLNVEALANRNDRLYATAFSFGDWDVGTHLLMNFKPDGSDMQYNMLMSGGMEDIISIHIGNDGNYYMARVAYDGASLGQSQEGSTQDESAADMEPGTEAEDFGGPGEEGPQSEGPEGPESAGPGGPEEDAAAGPTTEYSEEYGPDAEFDNMEEFISSGEDSPANDPALAEEASDGITSPQDEYKEDGYEGDGEADLVITEEDEFDGSYPEQGEAVYMLTCMSADGQELWTAPAREAEGDDFDYYVNGIAACEEGVIVSGSFGLDLYSKEDGSFIRSISNAEELLWTSRPETSAAITRSLQRWACPLSSPGRLIPCICPGPTRYTG